MNSSTLPGLLSSWRQTSTAPTVKEQVAVLPDASVAVQVTVVVPTGKHVPDGGVQVAVTPGQLSEAVGGGKVTTTQVCPGAGVTAVMLGGHVMLGGCVSLTVMVKGQLAPPVSVQVTVVVPTGKNEPEGGEHVTVPQVPLVVGGG